MDSNNRYTKKNKKKRETSVLIKKYLLHINILKYTMENIQIPIKKGQGVYKILLK